MAQDVDSSDWRHGAAVSLKLDENEREFDRCPVHFDDGSDPWQVTENHIRVFDFDNLDSKAAVDIGLTSVKTLFASFVAILIGRMLQG